MTLRGDEQELELGSSGPDVEELQSRLRGLGFYYDRPNGTFDDATEQALRDAQGWLGLDNDGRVGAQTWEYLDQKMTEQGLDYNPYAAPDNQLWDQPGFGQQQGQGENLGDEQWPAQPDWPQQPQQQPQGGYGENLGDDQWPGQSDWSQQGQTWDAGMTEQPPVVPHPDNIHPAIKDDERFSSFHDFLREHHGA